MNAPNAYSDRLYFKCQVELRAYELSKKVLTTTVTHLGRGFSNMKGNGTPLELAYATHCREFHSFISNELYSFYNSLNQSLKNRFIKVASFDLKKFETLAKMHDLFVQKDGLRLYFVPKEPPRESSHVHEEFGRFKIEKRDIVATSQGEAASEKALLPFIKQYEERLMPSLEMFRDGSIMTVKRTLESRVHGCDREGFYMTLKLTAHYSKRQIQEEQIDSLRDGIIKTHTAVKRLRDSLRHFRADYKEILLHAHECNKWLAQLPPDVNVMPLPYNSSGMEPTEDRETLIQTELENYGLYLEADAFLDDMGSFSPRGIEELSFFRDQLNEYLERFHKLCDIAATDPESLQKLLQFKECKMKLVGYKEDDGFISPYILIDEPPPPKGFEESSLVKEIDLMGYESCLAYVEGEALNVETPPNVIDEMIDAVKKEIKIDNRPRIFGTSLFHLRIASSKILRAFLQFVRKVPVYIRRCGRCLAAMS